MDEGRNREIGSARTQQGSEVAIGSRYRRTRSRSPKQENAIRGGSGPVAARAVMAGARQRAVRLSIRGRLGTVSVCPSIPAAARHGLAGVDRADVVSARSAVKVLQ